VCVCQGAHPMFVVFVPQATGLTAQSYRKVVTTARRDKKAGAGPRGLTEEQKQEIRCVAQWRWARTILGPNTSDRGQGATLASISASA